MISAFFARSIAISLVLLALTACGTTDPLPDYRYFRLPKASLSGANAAVNPIFTETIEVQAFRADGVFGERPIVYSLSAEPERLLQYHYQLWTDPPGLILQRRFVDLMQLHQLSPMVSARTSPRAEPMVISGHIERLERVKPTLMTEPWQVVVSLRLRLERHRGTQPVLERNYEERRDAAGDDIHASVLAFGAAVDAIAARWAADLALANRAAN
jgi:cholesterol transport system auxiliary component